MTLRVGALGPREFPAGLYLYVGSARRGLPARVARHRATDKALRWHIDYLTSAAGVCGVWAWAPGDATECGLARVLSRAAEVIVGFGASDCACRGHLFRDQTGDGQRALEALAPAAAEPPDTSTPREGDTAWAPPPTGRPD